MEWFAFILGLSCRSRTRIEWPAPKFESRQHEQCYHATMMATLVALAAAASLVWRLT